MIRRASYTAAILDGAGGVEACTGDATFSRRDDRGMDLAHACVRSLVGSAPGVLRTPALAICGA